MKRLVILAALVPSISFPSACTDDHPLGLPRDGAAAEGRVDDARSPDVTHDGRSEFPWPDLSWPDHGGTDWTWPGLEGSTRDQPSTSDLDCSDPCTPGCPLDCLACPTRAGCCTKSSDCNAPDKRYCGPKNTCVQCLDGNVCPSTLYHWCYHNVCVQCLSKGYCPPQKPMCVNHRCVAP